MVEERQRRAEDARGDLAVAVTGVHSKVRGRYREPRTRGRCAEVEVKDPGRIESNCCVLLLHTVHTYLGRYRKARSGTLLLGAYGGGIGSRDWDSGGLGQGVMIV